MSQRNEIPILIASLLITVALLVCGGLWLSNYIGPLPQGESRQLPEQISLGEKILIEKNTSDQKAGVQAFANDNFVAAANQFHLSLEAKRNDPETRIYLNNAQLLAEPQAEFYKIAVVVPAKPSSNKNKALGILRGVAQAQSEINDSSSRIDGRGLAVMLADDANNLREAEQVAQELVDQPDVVAVIGHYTSETTLAALPTYQQNQLVLMSASSTSDEISRLCKKKQPQCFFFRTMTNNQAAVEFLADKLVENARQAAIFYSFNSDYSQSFHEELRASFQKKGGTLLEVTEEDDLSKAGFNAKTAVARAEQKGAESIALVPDGGTSAASLSNAIDVIETNQGRLWIAGSSSLYNTETLKRLEDEEQNTLKNVVAYTPWHYASDCRTRLGQSFCAQARKFWGTSFVSWRTATAYDATRALIAALPKIQGESDPGSRQELRILLKERLAASDFAASGATGVIEFDPSTHNRESPPTELVKILPCGSQEFSLSFVPTQYNNTDNAGLSCN